ncbi:MAG: hypothetical protein ABWZ76_04800 [Acidimicrobiales bacterium]
MTVDAIDRLLRQANPIPDPMQVEPVDGSYLFEAEASDATLVDIALEPEPGPRAKRRWSLVAAAAVAVLAIAACVLVVASRHDTTRTELPVGPSPTPTTAPSALTGNVGFVGVPPEGATPSTPPTGELVAAWYVHPAVGSIFPGARQVYADGRVLSFQVSRVSGWLEQRLTPEGVELVRSEIVSSRPDADVDPSTARGIIRVRKGGRLVLVRVGDRMLLRLAALETWLPPRVWEDRDATAYIPSTYAVCVGRAGSWEALPDPVQAVSLFPAPLPQLSGSPSFNDDPGGGLPPSDLDCWNVTTEQAREVAAAFDAAGIEPEVEDRSGWLLYRFDVPEPVSTAVDVMVWPVLPEGVIGMWGA